MCGEIASACPPNLRAFAISPHTLPRRAARGREQPRCDQTCLRGSPCPRVSVWALLRILPPPPTAAKNLLELGVLFDLFIRIVTTQMISVSNVSMRYGSKLLFEDVATTFTAGRRYGLTGPNGAGKSTFMKLLTGELPPQKGTVVRPQKLGILRQDQFAFDRFRVLDTVIMGNARLWTALEEREHLYAKSDMTDEDGMRLGELEAIVGEEDGYSAESEAAVLLQGLDIPEELHERTMAELQGGQKVRVLLAQALFGNPAALLLDEPTNHLDLDSIHWLKDFLVRYEGTLIVISHDRHFLNGVCTHIADIDYQTIITYTGGYDDMVLAKMQIRSRVESDNAQREKKIAQLNDFIARFSAGTRSSQVQSRRKEVERLQTTELAR